jgi:hypothetical protein
MICDLSNINNLNNIIKKEGLNLLVVSYGGSCSNTLVDYLQKNNYKCNSHTWEKILCHCPHYIDVNIPIIYIYDNPIKSFMSVKRRYFSINQKKLNNNKNINISDENLISLMIQQFNSWTNIKRTNVLVIKSCELFEANIVTKLENFLNKKINYFPIVYSNPKTDINTITNNNLINLFDKYKVEIDKINNYISE